LHISWAHPGFVAKTETMTVFMQTRQQRDVLRPKRWLFALAALSVLAPAVGSATAENESRYPFDPACPWGRLANGKGMLHRCLSESEARRLADSAGAPVAATPTKSKHSTDGAENDSAKKPASSEKAASAQPPYELAVGPIAAEEGEITVGRLHMPTDRYRACIDENGGLSKPTGKVVVKFLVRAELLRAEGASVEAREGVSAKAAECIAGVVDRRTVGTPSAPLTGAALTFVLRQKK
jgi:hypothetical protein